MGTILIVIILYIINVFFNRYLNKVIYRRINGSIIPFLWFIPVITTLLLIGSLIEDIDWHESKTNWFNGKNW